MSGLLLLAILCVGTIGIILNLRAMSRGVDTKRERSMHARRRARIMRMCQALDAKEVEIRTGQRLRLARKYLDESQAPELPTSGLGELADQVLTRYATDPGANDTVDFLLAIDDATSKDPARHRRARAYNVNGSYPEQEHDPVVDPTENPTAVINDRMFNDRMSWEYRQNEMAKKMMRDRSQGRNEP